MQPLALLAIAKLVSKIVGMPTSKLQELILTIMRKVRASLG